MGETLSLDYVLQMAERIERNGGHFYTAAAQKLPQAMTLLMSLAQMEVAHEQTFARMRKQLSLPQAPPIELQGELAACIRGLLEGSFFEVHADPSTWFEPTDTPGDIILTAIGLEKESIVFYEALRQFLPTDKDREGIDLIITEEVRHIGRLTKALEF